MDATVVAAIIGGVSGTGGILVGHLFTRRGHRAAAELTEAQTSDIETQVYERVIKRQETEVTRLDRRVAELSDEVTQLRARLEAREAEHRTELAQLRDERDAWRAECQQLRTQLVAREAELAAARTEVADLRTLAMTSPYPPAPLTGGTP